MTGRPARPILERLLEKIEPEPMSGCWLWTGAPDTPGYGQFRIGAHTYRAHRVVYEAIGHQEIPNGMTLDHLCRVKLCVNPDHLEPVSMGENIRRGISPSAENARKTHCPQGHPLTSDNLYYSGPKYKRRRCVECGRAKGIEYKERKRRALHL